MAQYPQRSGEAENCRDYLRTGRCKYGELCKYHHPPNVLNGGGIKDPLNPSDPPFPIRPNEPPCQYYLKHGTCKFGQTCKFDHPLLSPKLSGSSASGASSSPQYSPRLPEPTVLPQRPSEPDCIYYLRNGRCKYGSSCKYHHPIINESCTHNKKKLKDRSKSVGSVLELGGSAVTLSDGANAIPIHIISSTNNSSLGQGHIILKEGTFALMMNPNPTDSTGSYSSHTPNNSNGTSAHFYLQPYSMGSPGTAIATQPQSFYPGIRPPESTDNSAILGRGNSSQTMSNANNSTSSLSNYPLNSQMRQLSSDQISYQKEEFLSDNEPREKAVERSPSRSSRNYLHPSFRKGDGTSWMASNSTGFSPIWDGPNQSNNFATESNGNNAKGWDCYNMQDPCFSTDDNSHRLWDDGLTNMTTSLLSMLDTSDERHSRSDSVRKESHYATPPRKVPSHMFRNQSAPDILLNDGSEHPWQTLFMPTSSAHGLIRDDYTSKGIFPP